MRSSSSFKQKRKLDDDTYLVDSIVDECYIKNQKHYKVHWHGFPSSEDSWEPEVNLSGVTELIREFHLRKQSSSAPRQSTSKKKKSEIASEASIAKSSPGSSSPRKRRMAKSRAGHFEYVPQNELIASKTKYFDDIRDGKIDLASNDLYSRVKTRRRCCNEASEPNVTHSPGRPSSLSELNEFRSTLQSTPTRHSEPSTPKGFLQSGHASIDEPSLVVPDSVSSYLSLSQLDVSDKTSPNPPKLTLCPPSTSPRHAKQQRSLCESHHKRSPSIKNYSWSTSKISTNDSVGEFSSGPMDVDPSGGLGDMLIPHTSKKLPQEKDLQVCHEPGTRESREKARVVTKIRPRSSVPSSSVLMSLYVDLSDRCCRRSQGEEVDFLSDFPVVRPIDERMMLKSQEDLLFAINNQHWSLLATQPIENIPIDCHALTNRGQQHPLVAAIVGGEGRPFLLRRLLQATNNPDFVDPISKWPLLVIAVYYGRIHAVRVLLELGAQPNATILVGDKQRTALGMAIATGDVDMISLLILSGANPYQVNGDMSAAQFIVELLQAVTSKTPYEGVVKAPPGFTVDPQTMRRQYEECLRPPAIPLIEPPEARALPRSPYDYLPPSSSSAPASTPLLASFDGQKPHLPSSDTLQCIYKLITSYHARLFIAVDRVVNRWLSTVGMTISSRLLPGQWIYLHGDSFTLNLPPLQAPADTDGASSVLVLFLVHGIVTPPGCYHVWLDDDGPCFVTRVLLSGLEQKPLGRQYFVCTLLPSSYETVDQCICVHFANIEKGVCIAPLALRLKPASTQRPQSTSESVEQTPEMPRLRPLPSTSGVRPRPH